MAFRWLNGPHLNSYENAGDYEGRKIVEQELVRRIYTKVATSGDGLTMSEVFKLISRTERKVIIDKTEKNNGLRSFMNKHSNIFTVSKDVTKGSEVVKTVVDIEFCKVFDSKQGCSNKACKKLHVCRHFVKGKCTFGSKCKKPHQFDDPHTRKILRKHFLDGLAHSQLKEFLCRNVQFALDDSVTEASLPKQLEICKYYNVAIGCSREGQCPFLHMCRFFAEEGMCKFGQKCIRKHDFCNAHARTLLLRYSFNEHDALTFLRKKVCQNNRMGFETDLGMGRLDTVGSSKLDTTAFLNITNMNRDPIKPRTRSLDLIDSSDVYKGERGVPRKLSDPPLTPPANGDTEICERGIRGLCSTAYCPKMHYSLPFCWQYSTDGSFWKDVDQSESIRIEEHFVDVGTDDMVIQLGENQDFVLKFPQLVAIQKNTLPVPQEAFYNLLPVVVRIRRLSTPSALRGADSDFKFHTKWLWYYLDKWNNWQSYDREYVSSPSKQAHLVNSSAIEVAFLDPRRNSFQYKREGKNFVIDFKKMIEESIETKAIKKVRRRPKNVCLQMEYSIERDEDERITEKSFFPSYWKTTAFSGISGEDCELMNLNPRSKEYLKVLQDFGKSLDGALVTKIMAVQNPRLWMTYAMKREKLAEINSSTAAEKSLYRAVSWESAEQICKQGFEVDSILDSELKDTRYFARNIRLANRGNLPNQAGLFVMFLCKVLINSCVTKRLGMREVFAERYSYAEDLSMYYVLEFDQVYPEFVIVFKA